MKRFFFLLCALVLFSSFALSESDYIGQWIHTEYLKDGTLTFRLLELREDHTSVIVFGKADGDPLKVPGRSFIGTWLQTPKGIHVSTGENTSKDLTYKDGFLFEKYSGMTDIYSRISAYGVQSPVDDLSQAQPSTFNDPSFEDSLPNGVLIPSGDYIVGVDLPAGNYRADVVSDVGGVCSVYSSASDKNKISEVYLGNMYGTLTFRLVIENGNLLQIKYNSLKIYPYTGIMDFSVNE